MPAKRALAGIRAEVSHIATSMLQIQARNDTVLNAQLEATLVSTGSVVAWIALKHFNALAHIGNLIKLQNRLVYFGVSRSAPISCGDAPELREGLQCLKQVGDAA